MQQLLVFRTECHVRPDFHAIGFNRCKIIDDARDAESHTGGRLRQLLAFQSGLLQLDFDPFRDLGREADRSAPATGGAPALPLLLTRLRLLA